MKPSERKSRHLAAYYLNNNDNYLAMSPEKQDFEKAMLARALKVICEIFIEERMDGSNQEFPFKPEKKPRLKLVK